MQGLHLCRVASPGPGPCWKEVWPNLPMWTRPAWPGYLGVGTYGSQIGVHMCGERPAAVIPVHAAGNNFWLQQHSNQLAGFMNSFQVVKVSKVGCQEKAPMHQPSFSKKLDKCRDDANNSYKLMVWLDSPRLLETGLKKTLELGPPLTMQQGDKHACLTVCSLAAALATLIIRLYSYRTCVETWP